MGRAPRTKPAPSPVSSTSAHTPRTTASIRSRTALRSNHITPDVVVTSTLHRAVRTAELVCDALGTQLPTEAVWQLNERNYGALTG